MEEEMATHSSIPAWKIPWTEEPGGLQSTGLQRAGHDWAPGHIHTHIHTAFTKFCKHALYIRKQYHSSSTDYVLSNAITDFKH